MIKLVNGDCLEKLRELHSETVDLVVADPPYFKVVNEKWDYNWRTEKDYLDWCIEWLNQVQRVLRKGGSFYLFGYFRILVHLVPILDDLGFSIRQQIIVDKGMRAVTGRATKNYKMFPNVTESILFCYKDPKPYVRELLKNRQKALGLTSKKINQELGVKSNGGGMWSIYTGNNVCEQLPTKEHWDKLEEVLDFKYPYEKLAITFNQQMGFTDVWNDIDFYEEKRFHPTQKPQKLLERIIIASSNENDVVLDPFMGSGSTGVACKNLNRQFIGIELDEKYYNVSFDRIYNKKIRIVQKKRKELKNSRKDECNE